MAIVAAMVTLCVLWLQRAREPENIALGDFQAKLLEGQVIDATLYDRDNVVQGKLADGTKFRAPFPREYTDELTEQLLDAGVDPEVDTQSESLWMTILVQLLPVAIAVGAIAWLFSGMAGTGGRFRHFGKSRARQHNKDKSPVTFADVAGYDEAVEELREIKEFLENPAKFQAMGAKIPKGVLLYGPPGTGKTLLARAVAGEAGVPFYSISGSDFVEMFVGVGASRVRDLFEQAQSSAPAIVFVDEIDAVGRHRGAGLGGGHDEREQTLNQLLVEMDGFDVSTGVILIAATNRPDILDPALLRPGRFDRQIVVDRPDLDGRRAILGVHTRGKPLGLDVDLDILARRTPGFTGADLANMVNEAAILAARHGTETINMCHLEEAIERVIAGPERKTRVMSEKEKWVIAYHEAGHALVGHVLPNTDPIHKVSIIARGRALGWTLALPTEDRNMRTRSELLDELAMLMGGRTAEELIFGDPTTGAQNDIERATQIARAMVTQFGMSEVIGPQRLGSQTQEVFLGKDMSHEQSYSDEMAARIDSEVRRLLDEAHREAREILTLHRPTLDLLAAALVEHETLGDEQLAVIFGELDQWVGGAGSEPDAGEAAQQLGRTRVRGLFETGASSDMATGGTPRAVTETRGDTEPADGRPTGFSGR
ncbi:MAG: ATP-dependent zinc metalloprotease FtsH [Acidimicrobiales bacterium]|nr:ATP-dependent zinc metalloprotease FtsH [Acidimicrobiales bacterium]